MNLGDLITTLEAADPNQTLQHGFHNPHSYRGDYMDLAFEPTTNITVADMLTAARSALGTTYQGYKGGDFTMNEYSWCWLSEEGDASGETISALLLQLMLTPAAPVLPTPVDRAATLTDSERTMLVYALDQAQERIWSEDGFTDEDQAAVDSLRRMAAEAPATEEQDEACDHDSQVITHEGVQYWACLKCGQNHGQIDDRPAQPHNDETPCGPTPDECGDEPCANHEREQAHAEGEHCFCGPECGTEEAKTT